MIVRIASLSFAAIAAWMSPPYGASSSSWGGADDMVEVRGDLAGARACGAAEAP
tara:strand:- start:405 stop:566 length:162 start_codon:yes stop_codon:yes gene_type:complete